MGFLIIIRGLFGLRFSEKKNDLHFEIREKNILEIIGLNLNKTHISLNLM